MITDRTVNFKRNTYFVGRNGMFKQSGVSIKADESESGVVRIEPITSKGGIGHAVITIPKDQFQEFISNLLCIEHE